MTKLEICEIEDANPGVVYLYPEGSFFKAYQRSAWLLCSRVHPFKVSARPLKGLDGPLLSVGFPLPEKPQPAPFNAPFNSLPVYGAAYRLARELT